MPSSDNITVPYVSSVITSLGPSSALDIGIGMGKFGFLFREACEWRRILTEGPACVRKDHWHTRLDGVEVCSEYITALQRFLYDRVWVGRAENLVEGIGQYDLIHLGDVVEHMEKGEGLQLVRKLFEKAVQGVLVVTPVGQLEQERAPGNPFEEHRSVWSPEDFREYPCVWSKKVCRREWVMFIARERRRFADPTARRHEARDGARSAATRAALKASCRALFGQSGLDVLVKAKQRMEGWK